MVSDTWTRYSFNTIILALDIERPDRHQIFTLRHPADPSRVVHLYLISLHAFPLKAIVEGCWTTSLVNFISYRMAYSMFPSSTFTDKAPYLLENLGRNWDLPLQKYRDRGLHSEVLRSPRFDRNHHAFQKCRKAGDKYSWKIPLDTRDMQILKPDPVPEDEIIYLEQRSTQLERTSLTRLGFKSDTEKRGGTETPSSTDGADIVETFHFESELHRIPCAYVAEWLHRSRDIG